MDISIQDDAFRETLKEVMVELLMEKGDLFKEILQEAMEDVALGKAIEAGINCDLVPRDEVIS